MGAKRKQSSPAVHNSRKRARDPEESYALRSIIDERPGHYLIDWEDDPVTGKAFDPTWEPKRNVTKPAIQEWNAEKSRRARIQKVEQAPEAPPAQSVASTTTPAGPLRPRQKPRRIIDDSSQEVSPKINRTQAEPRPVQPPQSSLLQEALRESGPAPEVIESQLTAVSDDEQPDSPLFEPIVEPSLPHSSFLAGDYQKFSSSSQATPDSDSPFAASSAPIVFEEQSRSVPVDFGEGSSRVIPDSQTVVDLTSSAPPVINSSGSGEHIANSPVGETVAETPAAPPVSASLFTRVDELSPALRTLSGLDEQQLIAELTESVTKTQAGVAGHPAATQHASSQPSELREQTGPSDLSAPQLDEQTATENHSSPVRRENIPVRPTLFEESSSTQEEIVVSRSQASAAGIRVVTQSGKPEPATTAYSLGKTAALQQASIEVSRTDKTAETFTPTDKAADTSEGSRIPRTEVSGYVIPIAFVGHQRDQYSSLTEAEKQTVDRFLATTTPDAQLLRKAEHLVENKRQVALHPDLANAETLTPYDVRPEQEAQWIIDILDTFLTGIHVQHRRMHDAATSSLGSEEAGLLITIVSTRDEVHESQLSPPTNLVLALDPSGSGSAMCTAIRALPDGAQTPLATLIVPYTIQHLEQSISAAVPEHTRLRTLVSGFNRYRHDAGIFEEGHLERVAAAQALATYLAASETGQEWPLPNLAPLENLDSQTDSDVEPATQDEEMQEGVTGTKRALDYDDTTLNGHDETKKARIEMVAAGGGVLDSTATINPQELEITHISDSLTRSTQAAPTAVTLDAGLTLSEAEQSLQRMLQQTQARLEEHVSALSEVQYRNEDLHQQLAASIAACSDVTAAAQEHHERATNVEIKFFALRAQHGEFKQQLADAKARLADHTIPERAEFEKLRLAAERSEKEKSHSEKRLAGVNKDLEFLREQYQTVSQSAQALLSQVADLETSLAVAQELARGEHVKLRQMGYDAQTQKLRDENRKLKAMLQDRDAVMKFRDEEIARLKEAARGRMGTRGTSVPRSPRLGSPMKMVDGGLPRGRDSRQGSPAAGEPKGKAPAHLHPLRNVE
ncbi:hypothetical protein B0A54_09247 [Friedmanniomyces endolithicus]|uniref:Chromo domain-containing protein n=1 Tax=Friedmanniomyces endolithicus TaxID=329885 RepID=A0A4U0UR19_9PEZI|nr:hypothetical protein B0A54_09247 [Friedmanniomyces endolithicus]